MKKIECFISIPNMNIIKRLCKLEGYTKAEFTRRALEEYCKKKIEELKELNSILKND